MLLEARVQAHGADVGAARSTGEVQQDRVGVVRPTDEQRLLVPVDVDGGELGDAAWPRLTLEPEDRCGRCRCCDQSREGREPGGQHGQDSRSQTTEAVAVTEEAGCDLSTPACPDRHRCEEQEGEDEADRGPSDESHGREAG